MPTYESALALLLARHTGTEAPAIDAGEEEPDADAVIRLLRRPGEKTLETVYDEWYGWKYDDRARGYSESAKKITGWAWKTWVPEDLKTAAINTITYSRLQAVIDGCDKKRATKEQICSLFKQVFKYAASLGYIQTNCAAALSPRCVEDEVHGRPFTDDEIRTLWALKDKDQAAALALVMMMTGFRISAYATLEEHFAPDWYLQGGVKTDNGKNRIVPIPTIIQPTVEALGSVRIEDANGFRSHEWKQVKSLIGANHRPHDTRHTYSALLERAGVSEADRARLLGHTLKSITTGVYGHRSLEDLRTEVEKLSRLMTEEILPGVSQQ